MNEFTLDNTGAVVGNTIDTTPPKHPGIVALLRWFEYAHLPEHLQAVSLPFHRLAHHLADSLPGNAETTTALRKLLEAKDCAVRAALS